MEIGNEKIQVNANDADLSGSQFFNSNLEKAGFDDVNLHAVSFTDCNLSDAVFSDVNLANASITNANIEGLTINGMRVFERTAARINVPGAVIFAKDIARLAQFYEHVLAMTSVHSDDDYIVLESTDMQLTLHAIAKPSADSIELSNPPARRTNVAMKLCLPVANITTARERVAAFGGEMNPPMNEWNGVGFKACDGHDPEGNIIQFREGRSLA